MNHLELRFAKRNHRRNELTQIIPEVSTNQLLHLTPAYDLTLLHPAGKRETQAKSLKGLEQKGWGP